MTTQAGATFCEQCGAALTPGAKFCAACGTAASSPAQPPIVVPTSVQAPAPPTPAKPKKRRHPFRWLLIGLVAIIVLGAILSSHTNNKTANSSSNASTPPIPNVPTVPQVQRDAVSYIAKHGFDADRVQANVETVQVAIGLAAKSATQANVDQLAQIAQQAHDNLDNIRQGFAETNSNNSLNNAELNAFSGANDLKNAMGALVAYAGDPNAATLAHFSSQYSQARVEWNAGVREIWRLAHRKKPPTI